MEKMAREFSSRETKWEKFNDDDPNRRMTLEESPWLVESQGGTDDNPIIPILNPRGRGSSKRPRSESFSRRAGRFRRMALVGRRKAVALHDALHLLRLLESDGIRRRRPRDPIRRAFRYMSQEGLGNDVEWCMAHDCCWEFITFLNYTMSNFKDSSYFNDSFPESLRKKMLDFSFKHWKDHSPYLKLQLAMTLKRMGREKESLLVHESVFDSAKTTKDEGTSWAIEDKSWLWYNDTVETQAFALKELMEINPNDEQGEGLWQWLFLNKKLNHWKSFAGHERGHLLGGLVPEADRGRSAGARRSRPRPAVRRRPRLRTRRVTEKEPDRHPRLEARAGVRDGQGDQGRERLGLRQRDMALLDRPDAREGRRRLVLVERSYLASARSGAKRSC